MRNLLPRFIRPRDSSVFDNITDEQKDAVIAFLKSDGEVTNLDVFNRSIDIFFNVLNSAVAGVMFEYLSDYADNNDFRADLAKVEEEGGFEYMVNKHQETLTALSICFLCSAILAAVASSIYSFFPGEFKISKEIKNKISNFTTKQLREISAQELEESILQNKVIDGLDVATKISLSYSMAGLISVNSGLEGHNATALFSCSLAVLKFALDKIDKEIYRDKTQGFAGYFDSLMSLYNRRNEVDQNGRNRSILRLEHFNLFDEDQKEELLKSVKSIIDSRYDDRMKMQNDMIEFFKIAMSSVSFSFIFRSEFGDRFLDDEYIASAFSVAIASVGFNCGELLGDALWALCNKKNPGRVVPVLDDVLEVSDRIQSDLEAVDGDSDVGDVFDIDVDGDNNTNTSTNTSNISPNYGETVFRFANEGLNSDSR